MIGDTAPVTMAHTVASYRRPARGHKHVRPWPFAPGGDPVHRLAGAGRPHRCGCLSTTSPRQAMDRICAIILSMADWEYEKTHPWLRFERTSIRGLSTQSWTDLGEAYSKMEHLAGVPLPPAMAERLLKVFLAKGALATTAIEGNTLTEAQALEHLEGRLRLPASLAYQEQEIANIIAAFNRIKDDVMAGSDIALSPERIQWMNEQVLKDLEVGESVEPGRHRADRRGVGRYAGPSPTEVDHLMERLCEWLPTVQPASSPDSPQTRVIFAIIRAILGHLYLVWIHPFGDGNGRTARLLEVQTLLEAGCPTVAAQLLSNHYNQTRTEYYRRLDQSSQAGGSVLPFLEYAISGLVDQLRLQVDEIRNLVVGLAWNQFVHERISDHGATSARRRLLALDLPMSEPTPRSELREASRAVAEAYAGRGDKTLTRDLNALVSLRLIERTDRGYRPAIDSILAFRAQRSIEALGK